MASAVAKDGARTFDSTDSGPAAPDPSFHGNFIVALAFAFNSEFHNPGTSFIRVYIYICMLICPCYLYIEKLRKKKQDRVKE